MSTKHPAKFNDAILAAIESELPEVGRVLDPFAGTGRIHELATETRYTYGIELEAAWADMHPSTTIGNALTLPWIDNTFDAIATSPTYGNRMADTYDGRDGSKRNTYRTALGQDLRSENSGAMQWGDEYREFHGKAWTEARRVLKPGGVFVLNVKDHIRKGERQYVTNWHVVHLQTVLGFHEIGAQRIPTRGNGFGANGKVRIDYEEVVTLWLPN